MFDQSYGLRFDIYERINLAEDLPGIDELEEAELIPHIQVISQQDQATLRGHLLLAGLYKGDSEAGETEPLEHWIPVEITVPLNRVSSLDDIAVEIENFDVDLLSKRSLNITGVLSLKGIQAAAKQTREASWSGEEFTVVHAPDQAEQEAAETYLKLSQFDSEPGSSSAASQPEAGHGEPIHDRVIEAEPAGENRTDQYLASWAEYERQIRLQAEQEGQQIQAGSGGIPAWPEVDQSFEQAAQAQAAQEEEASRAEPFGEAAQPTEAFAQNFGDAAEPALHKEGAAEPEAEPSFPSVWQFERGAQPEQAPEEQASVFPGLTDRQPESDQLPVLESSQAEVNQSLEAYSADNSAPEASSIQEEEVQARPEPKVAFTTKTSDKPSGENLGFSSLLQSSRTVQDQDEALAREEEEMVEETAETSAAEDVQWKSLFLGSRQEESPFRKVRMCIVQREETLELIAERYQLTPRELLLYNRMSEQTIEEGQVLYIPQ
ncbi:LysM peptidoglycan-binding domain-containing protein [Paenibacillus campinasensis]|uniref:Peptidoglycan-binding protein n=1 Tax=Paenibacillus campinasensis TaxID=66347 RepID=A0A268EG04_9BACL|nr:LysM peptidoglycan-binding domain-containing protein [Paenibacillus campinasensis]PAD72052.1 peptidoglycan-binding protein [Paenibacillus campinasensis]